MKTLAERARAREETKLKAERTAEIRLALSLLEDEMKRTEQLFNLTSDGDLIESCIFERNAQTSRLNYLCRLAKEL